MADQSSLRYGFLNQWQLSLHYVTAVHAGCMLCASLFDWLITLATFTVIGQI